MGEISESIQTIVLVDDNPDNLKVLFECLEPTEARILVCQSAQACLDLLKSTVPDLIITDILMPGMDGHALMAAIKSEPRFAHVPILVMSALSETEEKVLSFRLGAVDYVTKPFHREEVLARVRTQLTLQRQRQELINMARYDFLTGLLNRRTSIEVLEHEFDRARRYEAPLAIAILDIDLFKAVNDSYGHMTGDRVLQAVSASIRKSIRGTDSCGRFGGEEFLIVFTGISEQNAVRAADKVRTRIAALETKSEGGEPVKVTASLGVAWFGPATRDVNDLLREADTALYAAKEGGRNAVRHQEPRPK